MNKYKIIDSILLILATVMLCFAILISSFSDKDLARSFLGLMMSHIALITVAIIGTFLALAPNSNIRLLGDGMTVAGFAYCFFCAVQVLDTASVYSETRGIGGAVLTVVATVVLCLRYLLILCEHLLKERFDADNSDDNIELQRVMEWKQLLDDGIINAEEYEAKRAEILGIKGKTPQNKKFRLANSDENAKIQRVMEWKKLLNDGIINAEEYEAKRTQILGIKVKSIEKDR